MKKLICIYTCPEDQQHLTKLKQTDWYKQVIEDMNCIVLEVYANPNIHKDSILELNENMKDGTLTIKTEEAYSKLGLKTYYMIKACTSHFNSFDYLIKVDSTIIDYVKRPEAHLKFEHFVKFGDFLEWEWVHGNKYGTLMGPLEDVLDEGGIMLLDIDVKGGLSLMDEFPDETIGIFIEPPGDDIPEQLEILEERLSQRGDESTKLIKNRLKRFATEIEFKDDFKFQFINEDLDDTVEEIEKIIKGKIVTLYSSSSGPIV